jgi:hypothetical protein
MLLSDLVNSLAGGAAASEALCSTSCPVCEKKQSLDGAAVDQSDDLETVYSCQDGCGPILIVSARLELETPLRNDHRIGLWIVRNPRDLLVRPSPASQAAMLVPACTDTLVD